MGKKRKRGRPRGTTRTMISIRLPDELLAAVRRRAREEGIGFTKLLEIALARHLLG